MIEASLLVVCSLCSASNETLAPPPVEVLDQTQEQWPSMGRFSEIEVEVALDAIRTLTRGKAGDRDKLISLVEAQPQNYAPPVFYALSDTLFSLGERDRAAFWFYAGQLRARFDANRCADKTARQAVAVMNNEYGPQINQYTFQDLDKLRRIVAEVVAWDRETPHGYDHRWINLHGMQAFLTNKGEEVQMSLPETEWSEIEETTRTTYRASFLEALEQIEAGTFPSAEPSETDENIQ